jgi:hypothetical protein
MRRTSCALALLALTGCLESVTDFKRDAGALACGTGTAQCGLTCVDLKVDDDNCGTCGTTCPASHACAGSRCLPKDCAATDCSADQVCVNSVACRERLCVNVACATGQTCHLGACEAESCGATPCVPGAVCVAGACTDVQCVGVQCGASATCVTGQCYSLDCAETDCAANQVCLNDVTCEDRRCVNVRCEAGQTCVQGTCRPEACGTMTCSPGNSCVNGTCTDTRCVGVTCAGGKVCREGTCTTGSSGCDAGVLDDPLNCGGCGHVCATPLNAPARCVAGQCGRGPCAAGFVDVDGDATLGCESTCSGLRCTLPDGGTITVTGPPVSEQSAGGFSASPAAGSTAQSNATHRHVGALGEGPGTSGASSNATHRNIGGLNGLQK